MNAITPIRPETSTEIVEAVIIRGDLSKLTPEERAKYYVQVCESVGLNPMTRPFEFITLNGKLVLYARRDAADQLRKLHQISLTIVSRELHDGLLTVHVRANNKEGRTDEEFGAVSMVYPDRIKDRNGNWIDHPKAGDPLAGEDRCNAILKAVTKAKRRATLSICGLGFLDETEVYDITAVAASEPPARTPMKTLPKKDARPMYTKLQAELDAATSRDALKAWAEAAAERIKILPEDWQDILRLRYEEAMLAFRQRELQDAQEIPHDADSVIWDQNGERDPTPDDGLDIPPSLRRAPAKPAAPKSPLTKAQQMILDIRELSPKDCLQWGLKHHDAYEQLNDQEKQEISDALMARAMNGSSATHRA